MGGPSLPAVIPRSFSTITIFRCTLAMKRSDASLKSTLSCKPSTMSSRLPRAAGDSDASKRTKRSALMPHNLEQLLADRRVFGMHDKGGEAIRGHVHLEHVVDIRGGVDRQ